MQNDNLIVNRIMNSFSPAIDLERQRLKNGSVEVDVLFLSSTVDQAQYIKLISIPFLESTSFEHFIGKLSVFGAAPRTELSEIRSEILQGSVIVIYFSDIYCLSLKRVWNDKPEETQTENTLLGSNKSFTEDIYANLSLVRSRHKRKELAVEQFTVGTLTRTKLLLVYNETLVKPQIIESARAKLESIKVETLQAAGQLEKLINSSKHSLFPTIMLTERPDRVALNLAQGKAAILVEGTPIVLVLPAVFFDFMSAMDDIYQSFWVAKSLIVLRYVALFITILLPAGYISIVSYNPELFRVQLTLSISGSRAAVPYPSYVEVLIMLFMIEALTEASLRLPKFIGSTATTVGGLILGQAAQQAGLVSSIMIIVTSAVAISNYVIPINAMSFAMRVVKYVLIVFASFFGIIGACVGIYLIICYLASLRSFGEPYLKLFIGEPEMSYPASRSAGDTH